MSEDEDTAEREPREAHDLEVREQKDAFMRRFSPTSFEGVAGALRMPADEQHLLRLGRALWSRFYDFYETCSEKRPSRAAVADRVRALRDAANLLASSHGARLWLWTLPEIGEAEEEIFFATAKRLASLWDEQLGRLSSPARAGRRRHSAFHDLIADLVPVYERLTNKSAKRPGVLRSKGGCGSKRRYGGPFYEFTVAIWRCVRRHIPEACHIIPASEDAVAEALRNHWPKLATRRGKN
jgi:hypothetical protein